MRKCLCDDCLQTIHLFCKCFYDIIMTIAAKPDQNQAENHGKIMPGVFIAPLFCCQYNVYDQSGIT